jgi:hypothetical protein
MGLAIIFAAGPRQRSHSQVQVPHFTVSDSKLPEPGGQVPVLHPPGRGWPGYTPQPLGSLFVASYDSQGYGGGIRNRLHTGVQIQVGEHVL